MPKIVKTKWRKKTFLDLFWWKRSSSSGWYSKLAWNLVIDGWSCDLRLYLYVWHSLHFGVKIKTSFLKKRENVFFRLFQSESLVGSQLWCGHLMGPLKVTFFSFLISSLSLLVHQKTHSHLFRTQCYKFQEMSHFTTLRAKRATSSI